MITHEHGLGHLHNTLQVINKLCFTHPPVPVTIKVAAPCGRQVPTPPPLLPSPSSPLCSQGVPRPGAALACAHRQDRGPPRHLTPTPVAIDIAAACSGLGVRRFASVQKTRASSLASPRAWRKLLRILLARCSRFCGNNIQARPTGDFLIPSGWPWVQHRN